MASETTLAVDSPLALPSRRFAEAETRSAGALAAAPGSIAWRLGHVLSGRHPVTVFLAIVLLGYVALTAASVALGLLLTRALLSIDPVARADERFVEWLVSQRSAAIEDASWAGSTLAGGHVIPAVIGLVVVACVLMRRWRVAAFVLFAVSVESATYRATTAVVPRERPDVERLERLPVDASYPSGHTAASIALFCGLALLAGRRVKNIYARMAIWAAALAIVPFVALSRMVRGMHHPLDVAGGVALGLGALAVVLLAARAAGVAAERSRLEGEPWRS